MNIQNKLILGFWKREQRIQKKLLQKDYADTIVSEGNKQGKLRVLAGVGPEVS